jgi:hypothetical protein
MRPGWYARGGIVGNRLLVLWDSGTKLLADGLLYRLR